MDYVKLSKTDKMILNSYIPIIEGLAAYLSNAYELVLHSLEDYEHSVISIINGNHTGRTIGAPITDLALKMLSEINSTDKDYIVYFSKNKKGEPLKSTTLAIRGEKNKVIGLLCINLYLNTPFNDLITSFTSADSLKNEDFTSNPDQLIEQTLNIVREQVLNDNTIMPSNKNKVIIERLYDHGIFRIKNSVIKVEKLMGISKNTIYMHIRNYENK